MLSEPKLKPPLCAGCPLEHEGTGFAPGEGPLSAKLILVGEALGETEARLGRPFVGATGRMLRMMCEQAGLSPSSIYITNVCKCRPPENRTPTEEEVNACKERYLEKELDTLQEANLIVPVGATALRTLAPTAPTGVTEVRGSLFYDGKHKLLPIVHPSFVVQGNPEFWSVTVTDLQKAKAHSASREYKAPKEDFTLNPSLQEVQATIQKLVERGAPVAIDIETIGISIERCNLLCVGVAWSSFEALCIPLLRQGGLPYWKAEEEVEVVAALDALFQSRLPKITQNGFVFDLPVLKSFGFRFAEPVEDTLVKHHVIASELPHSLAFLTSIYTERPYYKHLAKNEGGMLFGSDEVIRRYNCLDCCATWEANQGLDKDLDELGLRSYYNEVVRDLCWCVMQMQENGMLVDTAQIRHYNKLATDKLNELKADLEKALGYPFNPNSTRQVQWTLAHDLGLPLTKSSDEINLLKLLRKHPEAKPFIEAILNYRDLGKKKGTYLSIQPGRDGRVRSEFRVYGTLTWRLSSREPDLQNMPRETTHSINIKDIYCAPVGHTFVALDYRQLELRIPVYAARCTRLMRAFEAGEDVYLLFASTIFGKPITKKGPERQTAKTFKLADNYGAGPNKSSNIILKNSHQYFPPSTLKEYSQKMKKDYWEVYEWQECCIKEAIDTGCLYDGFGIPRFFFGRKEERLLIGKSWSIAATASGRMNRAMVEIYHHYGHNLQGDIKLICQVHDELLFEVPDSLVEETIKIVKPIMEAPVTIFGTTVSFPVEVKVGKRWGSMEVWNG